MAMSQYAKFNASLKERGLDFPFSFMDVEDVDYETDDVVMFLTRRALKHYQQLNGWEPLDGDEVRRIKTDVNIAVFTIAMENAKEVQAKAAQLNARKVLLMLAKAKK